MITEPRIVCPFCGSPHLAAYTKDGYRLYHCMSCDMEFKHPYTTLDQKRASQ